MSDEQKARMGQLEYLIENEEVDLEDEIALLQSYKDSKKHMKKELEEKEEALAYIDKVKMGTIEPNAKKLRKC